MPKMGENNPTKPSGNFYVVGASEYGGPSDPSSGTRGSCGKPLPGTHAFAELYMGNALGNLPCGTQLIMQTVGGSGATITATKLDIGAGGAPVQGHARRVDLWYQTAQAMGFKGTGLIRIKRVDGRPIIGPHDKETGSEAEGVGTFGIGVGPTVAPEASEKFKETVENIPNWAGGLTKFLDFITSSSGWARILKVMGGAGLLVIAVDQLTKISPETPSTSLKSGAIKIAKTVK
jgi:hypothetical protein